MIAHHPALGRQIEIQPSQLRVLAKSGWVEGPLPPPRRKARAVSSKATETKEPTDG